MFLFSKCHLHQRVSYWNTYTYTCMYNDVIYSMYRFLHICTVYVMAFVDLLTISTCTCMFTFDIQVNSCVQNVD